MTIGERIKKRRQELGLTVDELADLLGKNRATIYRYESNDIEKLPTTVLEPLAKALGVTPGYLMGWEMESINFNNKADENKPITQEMVLKTLETIKTQFAQLGDSILGTYCENEECILALFKSLNYAGKKEALKRILELTELARYTGQSQSNISVDNTNKTYTARVAAFGGNNKVYQLSEEQISRAMDILREDEEDEE